MIGSGQMNLSEMNVSISGRWTICVLYTVIITTVSIAPSSTFENLPAIPLADKIAHFFMYGIYAAVLLWTLQVKDQKRWLFPLGVVLFCGLYGAAMEFLQQISRPGDRLFSVSDMAANLTGAFFFTLARSPLQREEKKRLTL